MEGSTVKKKNDGVFVEITNKEIYNSIKELNKKIDEKLGQFTDNNTQEHNYIIQRLDRTNGKVKLNSWMATTAITIAIVVIGLLFGIR